MPVKYTRLRCALCDRPIKKSDYDAGKITYSSGGLKQHYCPVEDEPKCYAIRAKRVAANPELGKA